MAIRPTIYVGLGGTGIRAIAQTKKHFEDAYGKDNIPQQIAFLAIDFDLAAASDSTLATDVSSDFLQLNVAANPQTLYKVGTSTGDYSWVVPVTQVTSQAASHRVRARYVLQVVSILR